MELARPQIPEKPPIAAKPKHRPPPPRPPKPSSISSVSPSSPSSSLIQLSSQHNQTKNHCQVPQTLKNNKPTAPNTFASKPKLVISARANSTESLSATSEKLSPRSPEPPPLPSSPPRQGSLKPSSSLSLPASFRNKGLNRTDIHTSLTLTTLIPFKPPSPYSSEQPQKSPIRHVSPPRRPPPAKSPKPKHLTTPEKDTTSKNVNNKAELKQNKENKTITSDAQSEPATAEKFVLTKSTPAEIQASSKINETIAQTRKHPAAPPQRPTSPPSRPAPVRRKPSDPQPQLFPPLAKPTVPSKPQDGSSVNAAEKDINTAADSKSPFERRPSAPPPLPKNPPRGGFPRKPRSSSTRTSSTSESKPGEVQQNPGQTLSFHNGDSENANSESGLRTGIVSTTNEIQNNGEKGLQPQENDTTGGLVGVPKARIPPKPRPRTRPSFITLDNSEDFIQKSADVDFSKGDEDSVANNFISSNLSPDIYSEKKPELDYAEVYQRRSECHIQSGSGHAEEVSETHEVNISQSSSSSVEPSAILRNIHGSESESVLDSITDVSENEVSKHDSIIDDSQNLFLEEPEATCGMLREIEELLKNKLGDLELNLDSNSAENSEDKTLNTDKAEEQSTCDRRSRADSCSKSKSERSPSTSPVRPPRPKRQATITKLLGSQESLDTSSTECLASLGLSKIQGTSKKQIPPKPKRTFLPRVSRSHSDVTGMKSLLDSDTPVSEDTEHSQQEDLKPYLPPRLESLRRSDSCQSPPPLPPRNKPRSLSLREISGADQDTPPELPLRSSLSDLSSSDKGEPEMAENPTTSLSSQNASQELLGHNTTATTNKSKVPLCMKPRPTRKAPPPPLGSPRRSATFSPGDNKGSSTSESENSNKLDTAQASSSPTVKKSRSVSYTRPNMAGKDHDYHEISDSARAREANSQEKDETPPPTLLPRAPRASPLNDESKETPVKVTKDNTKFGSAEFRPTTPVSSNMSKTPDQVKKSYSPKEQKQMEKMAKSALIQKVAQSLGMGKSFKKSKIPAATVAVDEPDTKLADDYGKEKVNADCNTVIDSVTDTADGIKPSVEAATKDDPSVADITTNDDPSVSHTTDGEHIDDEFVQKTIPAERGSSSSSSSLDRPVSVVSQHSTGSEHEGSSQTLGAPNMEEIVSSGTDTEPEEDKEEIYAQRKAKKVFFIAKEIASSESTFVDVLRLLNLDFRFHISKTTEKLGHPVIPSEILNKILDFLPQLQNFNEDLLKDLQERIDKWETNPRLCDIFVKKGPFLKLYSSYIRNFENATAVLEDAVKKNPAFAAAVKEFEMSPRCAKLALKHYMLKPIQRIPQYKLLLQDYLKHLTESSPDYKDTFTALNIVSEVADHANDSMRHGDNVQKLLEVQRSLIGQFEVIQPGRVLVKQGELQKLSRKEMQPRMFFLFNDVLLYTTPATSGYRINNILPLTGMKINSPKLEDYKFEFNIISVQRSFTLSASSSEEKEQWVSALQATIEENAKKHYTFQTVKQGPQTSLQDKDFVLGDKAPLWVPDARVTMCMLCLLEFTLTWRRHHCRSCGRVVCSHCSENKAPLRYLKYQSARVCDNCYDNLRTAVANEFQQCQKKRPKLSVSEEDSTTSVSEGAAEDATDAGAEDVGTDIAKHDSGLSLHSLMARFQKIRVSNRDKRKPGSSRPSVLKEVHANDEGSDMSGYLRVYRSRRWKRLWFVVKGKVLYTYKASEDMAARESMPLLGYEVSRPSTWFEGAEPDLLFELTHQNNQPLAARKDSKAGLRVTSTSEKTNQRLIFRTDSAAATIKWVTVLKEASLT